VAVGGDPADEKVVAMAVMCPVCGAENPDSAEYCNLCLAAVGFEAPDCATPVPEDNSVYCNQYPSSFRTDTSESVHDYESGEARPEASPADVGVYGERTGYSFESSSISVSKKDESVQPPRSVLQKKV
jgi:hypothetical protein